MKKQEIKKLTKTELLKNVDKFKKDLEEKTTAIGEKVYKELKKGKKDDDSENQEQGFLEKEINNGKFETKKQR